MKITRDKMFFSKDLIHTMAYVGNVRGGNYIGWSV